MYIQLRLDGSYLGGSQQAFEVEIMSATTPPTTHRMLLVLLILLLLLLLRVAGSGDGVWHLCRELEIFLLFLYFFCVYLVG